MEAGRQGAEHRPALFTKDVVGLMAKPRTCTHSLQVLVPGTGPQGSREETRLFWEPQTAQRRRLLSADGTEREEGHQGARGGRASARGTRNPALSVLSEAEVLASGSNKAHSTHLWTPSPPQGVFPTRGSGLRLWRCLRWQGSLPAASPGKPLKKHSGLQLPSTGRALAPERRPPAPPRLAGVSGSAAPPCLPPAGHSASFPVPRTVLFW